MTALLLVPLVVISGGAIDLVRQETIRVKLQDALDRGTLAAASLTQTKSSRETVEGYLKALEAQQDLDLTVNETVTANSKKVSAEATISYETVFLRLAGIRSIEIPASAVAEERRQNIELSLLLDISGSMRDNGGIVQLKPAADNFIDAILRDDVKNVTSVNLIPFAGQVNVGKDVFDFLIGGSGKRQHNWSSCFELQESDFNTGMPDFTKRSQVPHFTYYNYETPGKQPWWCPTDDTAMTFMSNDAAALKKKIDSLNVFDGTGTAYAMKWGSLLLDPTIRPYMKTAAAANIVPTNFRDRPADYTDPDTIKFIVLMTDGQIGFQPRPKNGETYLYQPTQSSNFKELFSQSKAQSQLDKVCSAVKASGVTVFTIGFKLSDAVAAKLAECASSPSHAYRADGLNIADAFKSIATAIQKIKLTG